MKVVVPPTYPPGCKIVWCGEAPGPDEMDAKEGFVGKAGEVLQKITQVSAIPWASCGKTNVAKRAPQCSCEHEFEDHEKLYDKRPCLLCECKHFNGFDSEHFQSTFYQRSRIGRKLITYPTDELIAYRQLLASELSDVRPNVVVACGGEALKTLCDVDGISKFRGSILPSTLVPGLKVIPLMHPAWILRSVQYQEIFISSHIAATKIKTEAEFPHLRQRNWHEVLSPSINDVTGFIKLACQSGPFVLDIETRAGSIACVGLSTIYNGVDYAICVPIQTTTGPYFSLSDEAEFWRLLQHLMDAQPIIGQNVFYDLCWLREYGIIPSDVHDTMMLWHRMFPELPKGLDFLAMWFTDIPYYKDDGKTWGRNQPDHQLWSYNIKDCIATMRVWHALLNLANTTHKRPYQLYETYTRPLMPIAFEMQQIGMDVDPVGVGFARAILMAELDKVRGKLGELSNGALTIQPGNKKITDKQVAGYIYSVLNLPVKRNRKTKAITADEDALVELLIKFPDQEVLKAINAERKMAKALNSYIDIKWREGVL